MENKYGSKEGQDVQSIKILKETIEKKKQEIELLET